MKRPSKIFWLWGAIICITNSAFAAQVKDVVTDGEVEAFIASDELSRIKVISDRIRSVKANHGEVELLEDTALGEVYIRPKMHVPVNMFITTERDYTYKLLLLPKKIPSEQIFIRNKQIEESEQNKVKSENFKEEVISLIKAMSNSEDLVGFAREEVDKTKEAEKLQKEKENSIEASQKLTYRGARLYGEVLEIKNASSEEFTLSPEIFNTEGLIALSIEKSELMPEEATKVYMVRRA